MRIRIEGTSFVPVTGTPNIAVHLPVYDNEPLMTILMFLDRKFILAATGEMIEDEDGWYEPEFVWFDTRTDERVEATFASILSAAHEDVCAAWNDWQVADHLMGDPYP